MTYWLYRLDVKHPVNLTYINRLFKLLLQRNFNNKPSTFTQPFVKNQI